MAVVVCRVFVRICPAAARKQLGCVNLAVVEEEDAAGSPATALLIHCSDNQAAASALSRNTPIFTLYFVNSLSA